MTTKKIKCSKLFRRAVNTDKRLKILVGSRGSTKSTFMADYVLANMANGQLWCCAREYHESIEESVHRLMLDEVSRLELEGFSSDKTHIYHGSGGRNFYRGLARNPSGIKSMLTDVDGIWIEEGASLSAASIKELTASLRLSASDAERVMKGEKVKMPEIWITMNRGSAADPISKKWLKRAEKDLAKQGWYEDDFLLIIQINWDDIPKRVFAASGLEVERAEDEQNMDDAEYEHKWGGGYSDIVEDAIIKPAWFDACVDAHIKLGFKPRGIEVVSFDPNDTGADAKGLAYRHGVVFKNIQERDIGDVNEGCDWAIDFALERKPDFFIWDGDGMGVSLRRQVNEAFQGKHIKAQAFNGGHSVKYPDRIYEDGPAGNKKTNKQTFKNLRAQRYWNIRDRIYKTYLAIGGKYIDPDELISFSSDIEQIGLLRAQLCGIPRKYNGSGLIQIKSKKEMDIDSPNMADAVMMTEDVEIETEAEIELNIAPNSSWMAA